MLERMAEASPRLMARVAGIFYPSNLMTGGFGGARYGTLGDVANLLAIAFYIVVTVLFYSLYKPVNKKLSLVAALVSLAGCTLGMLRIFNLAPIPMSPLACFGFYCLLTGYLSFRSNFLPRIFGHIDGARRVGLVDLSITIPCAFVIAVQPCPRNARRRIVDPVATRKRRER